MKCFQISAWSKCFFHLKVSWIKWKSYCSFESNCRANSLQPKFQGWRRFGSWCWSCSSWSSCNMVIFFLPFLFFSLLLDIWLQGLLNPPVIPRQKVFNQQLVVINKEKKNIKIKDWKHWTFFSPFGFYKIIFHT